MPRIAHKAIPLGNDFSDRVLLLKRIFLLKKLCFENNFAAKKHKKAYSKKTKVFAIGQIQTFLTGMNKAFFVIAQN